MRIPCDECAFSTEEEYAPSKYGSEEVTRIYNGGHDVLFNFTTSEGSRRLELNGATIYPPLAWSGEESVVVHQVPASGQLYVEVPLRVTASGLETKVQQHLEESESEAAASALVELRYTVLGLEKQLMQLQAVKIDLLKTGDELLLLKVEAATDDHPAPPSNDGLTGGHWPQAFRPPPGVPPPHGPPPYGPPPEMTNEKECRRLPASVCKFKHMLEAKIAHLRHGRPCPGRMSMGPPGDHMGPPHGRVPSHVRPPLPHLPAHGEHPHPPHGRPHHMRPWHGRHHHGHHHGYHPHHHHFAGAFVRGFVAVLIPVVAGISVGLFVSLIGLVVGRLITWIWVKYARKGQRGTTSGTREDEFVEEGKGLMLVDESDGEEALPAYEDAPAYEASDEKISY